MKKDEAREKLEDLFSLAEKAWKVEKSYELFLINDYKEFIRKFKTVYLFGGGEDGRLAADFLWDVLENKEVYFIDNDVKKHGKELYKGICCYGKEKMFGCDPNNTLILITSTRNADEIYKELLGEKPYVYQTKYQDSDKLGLTYIDSSLIRHIYRYVRGGYNILNKNNIIQSFEYLDDDESATVFYSIFLRGISGNKSQKEIFTMPQYFPKEILQRLCLNEVFLDCGAADGDTIEMFRKFTNDKFKAIYAFEMDREIYNKLLVNSQTQDNRIVCFNAGISDGNRQVVYSKDGCPSYALMNPNSEKVGKAYLKSIDSLIDDRTIKEEITFVKMDIEGAELDALRGMEKMIINYKPKLAISIYHKWEDKWEIPIYIKSIVPEYSIIIRHHHRLNWETVLYAYIQ